MGVEDIMQESGASVEADPRRLPTTPDDRPSPQTNTPDETAAQNDDGTNDSDSDMPKPPKDPLGDAVDLKLSLDQAGDISAALSLVAKLFA